MNLNRIFQELLENQAAVRFLFQAILIDTPGITCVLYKQKQSFPQNGNDCFCFAEATKKNSSKP